MKPPLTMARINVAQVDARTLLVLDAATRKEIKRIAVGEVPVGVLITPDGRRAYIATMQSNRVVEINLENLTLARRTETGQGPDGMAWAVAS